MNVPHRLAHWKRLGQLIALPFWFAIGLVAWTMIETVHTLNFIAEHLRWLTTPSGNLFVLVFAIIWFFIVLFWNGKPQSEQRGGSELPKPNATPGDSDPRIEIEFRDDVTALPGMGLLQGAMYFTPVNRGQNSANSVCISPIRLRHHWVWFPEHAASLSINRSEPIHAKVGGLDGKKGDSSNLFDALFEEYKSYNDPKMHELPIELSATYQDDAKNLFETRCDLVFSPSGYTDRTTLGKAGSTVIQIRNHKYKKIADRIY